MAKRIILLLSIVLTISTSAFADLEWALYGVKGDSDGFHEGLCVSYSVEQKSRGYVDASGKLVIPYQFKYADTFIRNVARVKTDEGEGLIDRTGKFVLPPDKDYEIYPFDKAIGYYKVYKKSTNKCALFDGYRFLTNFEWDHMNDYNYPFIHLFKSEPEWKEESMNILTLDRITEAILSSGNYFVGGKGTDLKVYTKDGEHVDKSVYGVSSKGNELYLDEATELCGIRNATTKAIVVVPRYDKSAMNMNYWANDVIVVQEPKSVKVVLNADGRELLRAKEGQNILLDENYIWLSDSITDRYYDYYDYRGNLIPTNGKKLLDMGEGFVYIYDNDNGIIYDLKNQKQLFDNVIYPRISNGVIEVRKRDGDGCCYLYFLDTKKHLGPYDNVGSFNEDVAIVKKNGTKFRVIRNME